MRVLIACEYSGRVREAFRKLGHDAWSCDLLESEDGSEYHIEGDVTDYIGGGIVSSHHANPYNWDLMIAHPPCTHLAVSGARHFQEKIKDGRQSDALKFVRRLMDAPIKHIALENPISIISSKIRKPDQIIQPWQFGHGETKATCLWLKGLPPLKPTNIVAGREARVHLMPPSPNRWKERSRTYQGIADAMAKQWSSYIENGMKQLDWISA